MSNEAKEQQAEWQRGTQIEREVKRQKEGEGERGRERAKLFHITAIAVRENQNGADVRPWYESQLFFMFVFGYVKKPSLSGGQKVQREWQRGQGEKEKEEALGGAREKSADWVNKTKATMRATLTVRAAQFDQTSGL